jgi:hypothetical protein
MGSPVSTLETVARFAEEASLEFIVCGGFAVNAYQVMRKTGDIDLVVRERESKHWKDELSSIGYTIFHESGAFIQLHADSPSSWPIDLILVSDAKFDSLKTAGRWVSSGPVDYRIPSPEDAVEMILAASAEMLPVWNADPENEKRRLARKSGERFRLAESPAE